MNTSDYSKIDFIKTTIELNAELYKKYGDLKNVFSYLTNGDEDIILFGENILWSSEEDGRKYDRGGYEPFKPYIKRVYNSWLKEISKCKF